VDLGPGSKMHQKGIAVDDFTLQWCTSQIPDQWPNAGQSPMTSIRLFKAWDDTWTADARESMWSSLVDYVSSTNAKVLIGAQIHCSEQEDMQSWIWTKELLKRLKPEHVMGLAIGNELELLHHKGSHVTDECLQNIWERGYLWRMFQHFVAEFDAMGFSNVPVTSVFTGQALAGNPFYELPGKARVNTFLEQASSLYGSRFVFTWNFYPYFDPNQPLDLGTTDQCEASLAAATCWGENCFMPSQMRQARMKMKQLTGKADDTMWVGETGWSSPMSDSLKTLMNRCPAWSSMQTFQKFYRGFLEWDLSIGGGMQPPDHAFWFTMRDSINFGEGEHFGLIAKCDDPACKVTSAGFEAGSYELHMGSVSTKCGDAPLYDAWVIGGEDHCRNLCTLHDDRCRFYSIWPHSHENHHWCRLTSFCDLPQSSAPHVISTYKRLGMPPPPTVRPGATPQPIERGGDVGVTAGGHSILPATSFILTVAALVLADR